MTGDVRQANYSSLRAELVEFRRRVEQLQHGVIAHQLCRPIWARWMEAAVLAGALDLPGFASAPARWRAVQWIPPRWDWVDPLKDIQAQVLAIDAGLLSRRKAVEATGYDIEEIDRENAADAARAAGLGLTGSSRDPAVAAARQQRHGLPRTDVRASASTWRYAARRLLSPRTACMVRSPAWS